MILTTSQNDHCPLSIRSLTLLPGNTSRLVSHYLCSPEKRAARGDARYKQKYVCIHKGLTLFHAYTYVVNGYICLKVATLPYPASRTCINVTQRVECACMCSILANDSVLRPVSIIVTTIAQSSFLIGSK